MTKLDQLRSLVANALKVQPEQIGPEDGLLKTPGWDSMAHVSIMLEIERTFGVDISEELMNCRTVADLVEFLPE